VATYLLPQRDGEDIPVTRMPTSGIFGLGKADKSGRQYRCTGRMTDGTVIHRDASKLEYFPSLLKHHAVWCNATREYIGAPLAASSKSRASVAERRAALWNEAVSGLTEK
jgi:hypothetical protein